MSRRLKLHNALCDILSCPNKGPECRAYFQPPSSVKMKYPAIVYALDDIENTFANDGGLFVCEKVFGNSHRQRSG